MFFSKSIRWKIQAWHGFLLVILVVALCIGFYSYERNARLRELDSQLHELITPLLPRVAPIGQGPRPGGREFHRPPPPGRERPDRESPPRSDSPPRDDSPFASFESGEFYYVAWTPHGEVSSQSAKAPKNIPFPAPNERGLRNRGNSRELIHRVPNDHFVLVGSSTAILGGQLKSLAMGLTGAGLGVIAVGLIGGWWLTGRAISPIAEISTAAEKISGGDLSKRINVSETESELGQLAGVLNQTFERLEKSFAQQVRFTADASHELRTPISVILTQIQLALSRERSGEDYRRTLETCERAAERMGLLVNALLELARVDSGDFELLHAECDLGQIARDAIEMVEPLAKQKGVTLNHAIESVKIRADALKLGQVFINLLTNAIQHNKDGVEICVSVKRNGDQAVVRIADNGMGIPAESLLQIFDRFYRVDPSRSRAKGNSGLGLAICKAILEAHGGKIDVKSQIGAGAEFILTLPISSSDTPKQ